jgi:hypothetical protein
VGVLDVLVVLPQLWPEIRVTEVLLGKIPQRVARFDDVDLGVRRELGGRLVRRGAAAEEGSRRRQRQ